MVDTDDEGSAEVIVYAPAEKRPTLGQNGDTPGRTVVIDDLPLWRGMTRVSGRRFAIDVTLPEYMSGDMRIAVRFKSVAGQEGYCMSAPVRLMSGDAAVADKSAPSVTLSHCDGKLVAATFDDGSGVNSCAGMLGNAPSMTVDGAVNLPLAVRCLDDGTTQFTAETGHLLPGSHEACFRVSDNAGNRAESRCRFSVAGTSPVLSPVLPEGILRDNVEISWTHDLTGDTEITLIVTDLLGNTVTSRKLYGADSCELDVSGMKSGIYLVRLLATDGNRRISAEPRRITVIR